MSTPSLWLNQSKLLVHLLLLQSRYGGVGCATDEENKSLKNSPTWVVTATCLQAWQPIFHHFLDPKRLTSVPIPLTSMLMY